MLTTGNTRLKAVNLVWNKIPSREKTKLCETIDRYAATLGLHSLDTVMVNSTKFAKGRSAGRTDGYVPFHNATTRQTADERHQP